MKNFYFLLVFTLICSTASFSQENSGGFLPVSVIRWSATLKNSDVVLTWTTTMDNITNDFVIERSLTGVTYNEIATLSIQTSGSTHNYNYSDKLNSTSKGTIYYRLKSTDRNGRIMRSDIRMVRVENIATELTISAFPNPAINELKITIPANWQDEKVTYSFHNLNGFRVKQIIKSQASQTEALQINDLKQGIYMVKASGNSGSLSVRMVKL